MMANKRIMLDAGHYANYNRSPVVPAYWESKMTWSLHLKLKAALERYGFEVLTTRTEQDKDLSTYDRGRAAKGCDLFLSLHSNACDTESVDRVVVFRAFDNRNNAEELGGRLAASIAELMGVSYGRVATRESKEYPGQEYYGVLRGARAANVPLYYIIEHSFHTNKKATEWLLVEDNLQRLADLEAAIIAAHFGLDKERLLGDVNGDGKVNAQDYLLVKRAIYGLVTLTEEQEKAADVNGDGKVDAVDCLKIKRAVLGLCELN